jgi:hypothetical protein
MIEGSKDDKRSNSVGPGTTTISLLTTGGLQEGHLGGDCNGEGGNSATAETDAVGESKTSVCFDVPSNDAPLTSTICCACQELLDQCECDPLPVPPP